MLLQVRERLDQRIWRCHDSLLIIPERATQASPPLQNWNTGQGVAIVMIQGQKRGGGSAGALASPKGSRQSGSRRAGEASLERGRDRLRRGSRLWRDTL